MATRPEAVGDLFARQHRAKRESSSESLGQGHDVWFDSKVLVAEQLPGAPHSGLNFIEDEQDAALIAELTQASHVGFIRDVDAALSLNRLNQYRGGFLLRSEEHTSELQSQSNLVC